MFSVRAYFVLTILFLLSTLVCVVAHALTGGFAFLVVSIATLSAACLALMMTESRRRLELRIKRASQHCA